MSLHPNGQPFYPQLTSPVPPAALTCVSRTPSHDRPKIAGQWTHRAQALLTPGWMNYGQLSTRANKATLTLQA